MNGLTDTELGKKIRSGSESAFKEIYTRYHIQMFYIAKKYVKSTGLAEDAIQDVFIKLWNKRHTIDETKSMSGLLFTILRNHLLNMLRDQKREIISITDIHRELMPSGNLTDDEVLYREYHEIFQQGLDELSERKREIFELRTLKGYSNSEVADLLKINVRTVKTHYYLSSRFIRAYLKDHADIILILISLSGFVFLS